MFLNIDYAKRAAARDTNIQSLDIISIEDDNDIDYEQLFDGDITIDNSKIEIKKPIKRVRFAPNIDENSLTPILPRSSSVRPRFDIEFDFDSLVSPSNELNSNDSFVTEKSINWKEAFLSDLHIAKNNQPTLISSPSIIQIDNKTNQDTLWDFMKESNPELFEKIQRIYNDKQKRIDRFSIQQPTLSNKINSKITKSTTISDKEGIQKTIS
ncbi:unnamed protein product [Rotaria sordida]|uniref:Uncharacterized protein n=1 Tax=Rotaria sordida TaxID=392033 RepID=A0A818Z5T3_9BILA|nr:unnamed protein product [Rotaria sordida]